MSILRFAGRTVLVTGGASGIGAATARRLAAEGATVAVADLDEPGAAKVAAEIDGYGVRLDVADLASVRSAIAQVEDAIGPVDVLVNNAGGDRTAYFVDSSPDDWDHWIAVNLRGTMACTHVVLPGMQDRRRGAIVNMASEAGRAGLAAGAARTSARPTWRTTCRLPSPPPLVGSPTRGWVRHPHSGAPTHPLVRRPTRLRSRTGRRPAASACQRSMAPRCTVASLAGQGRLTEHRVKEVRRRQAFTGSTGVTLDRTVLRCRR